MTDTDLRALGSRIEAKLDTILAALERSGIVPPQQTEGA